MHDTLYIDFAILRDINEENDVCYQFMCDFNCLRYLNTLFVDTDGGGAHKTTERQSSAE